MIKPVWIFGIDRQVQNVVGPEAYGIYFSLFNLSLAGSFLIDCGLTTYYSRHLAAQENTGTLQEPAGRFIVVKLLLSFVYTLLIVLIAAATGVRHWDVLLYVILFQVLNSFFLFFRSLIVANQWFRADAILSVVDKSLMIMLCGVLLYGPAVLGTMYVNRFLLLQIVCLFTALLLSLFVLYRKGVKFSLQKKWLPSQAIILQALPFGVIILLMGVHNRLDGFLLERLRPDGPYQAGIYASAYRLLDVMSMTGNIVTAFLLSYIARRHSNKQDISSAILSVRHGLMAIAILATAISVFLAAWIQGVLYHHTEDEAIVVLQYCMPAIIGYALIQVYGTVLTATGHIRVFCYTCLAAVVLNIGINAWLIPMYGARGACIAAVVSQLFCGLATMIVAQRRLHITADYRSWFIYFFIALAVSAFLYGASRLAVAPVIQVAGAGLLVGLLFLVTGLINWREWKLFAFSKKADQTINNA